MNKPLLLAAVIAVLVLAACGARPASARHAQAPATTRAAPATTSAPASPSAPPSPVSALATVTGMCVTGIYDVSSSEFYSMASLGQVARPGSGDEIAEAYQLALTDMSSSATAEVAGFAVVFYSGNQELTSDQQSFTTPSFITPGQSLAWTEYPWGTSTSGQGPSVGPFAAGEVGAVNSAVTCQLIQWYHA